LGGQEESPVLHIEPFIIDTLGLVAPLVRRIEVRDSDLARQITRAGSSIALNVAEGAGSQGRNEQARYYSALGSAHETLCALKVAVAWGYIAAPDAELIDRFQRIIATLKKLSRRR
jgi:four helix bundle protein